MKITNIRIGRTIDAIFSGHPLFQGEQYKLISPCYFFLERINSHTGNRKEEFTPYSGEKIQSLFKSFDTQYKKYLDAMVERGLLKIKRCAVHGIPGIENRSNEYGVTKLCRELLVEDNKEYLRKIHNDPQEKKKVSNRRKQAKFSAKPCSDYVEQTLTDNLHSLSYDIEAVNAIKAANNFTDEQLSSIDSLLIRFSEGKIGRVNRSEKDGRIHHQWVRLKREMRGAFRLGKFERKCVVDLRCCHPSFFSLYILNLSGENLTATLKAESDKWIDFWGQTAHPRNILMEELTLDKEKAKEAINSAFNGLENPVMWWVKKNYPLLFSVWDKTNKKLTGNAIARDYEGQLMLSEELFKTAESLNVKILSEHDGFSLFAAKDDKDVEEKVKKLTDLIAALCFQKFNFFPVIKAETV